MNKPISKISREDIELLASAICGPNSLDQYQRIATKSAIYPGQGTPFGLMYAALGLAEAGEVQNKVKKAFRDDACIIISEDKTLDLDGGFENRVVEFAPVLPERRAQIIKELGGALWYIAAVCNEIGATMSEIALVNLEELCDRGERGVLSGDGDNR